MKELKMRACIHALFCTGRRKLQQESVKQTRNLYFTYTDNVMFLQETLSVSKFSRKSGSTFKVSGNDNSIFKEIAEQALTRRQKFEDGASTSCLH
jgi:hypothetical protein